MSVIYGRIHLDKRPVANEDLDIMESRLNHWKADNRGTFIKDNVGLGHLMLYNTSGSLHEPLPYGQDESVITCDARIDNRGDICRLLSVQDDETQYPDSRLILHLYGRYGKDCVKHITGDFAFAIWDEKHQQLFCARDHMGVKPFFYSGAPGFFAFASEKKGLLAIPGLDKAIDKDYLYNQVLNYPDQLATTTLYLHIRRLAPAHTLTLDISKNSISIQRYWTLDVETELKLGRKEDYYEGLRHHFDEAVKCRVRTVYTPGAELSGGLDSSAIVGAACKFTGNKLVTFSNTLAEGVTDEQQLKMSERTFIEDVIGYLGIKDYVLVTEDVWKSRLDEADFSIDINDGLEMWNPLWQIGIKQAAMQKDVRVLLSGFPGDQMVTYKGRHQYLDQLQKKQYIAYFKGIHSRNTFLERARPFMPFGLQYGLHKVNNAMAAVLGQKQVKHAKQTFHVPLKYLLNRRDAIWKDEYFRERYKSHRHYMRAILLKPIVAHRMESETRYGIHFRMEPQFPMADIRLTQFYLSMPAGMKHNATIERHTYRQAVKDYLPESVLNRIKGRGSMAPFLNNKENADRSRDEARAVFRRLQGMENLPLRLREKTTEQTGQLMILRWLERWYTHQDSAF